MPPFQAQPSKLIASDAADGDLFGSSVAIDGEYVIIGARRDDLSGTDAAPRTCS